MCEKIKSPSCSRTSTVVCYSALELAPVAPIEEFPDAKHLSHCLLHRSSVGRLWQRIRRRQHVRIRRRETSQCRRRGVYDRPLERQRRTSRSAWFVDEGQRRCFSPADTTGKLAEA